MASRLSPCPSCTRHVKVGAASCPFCGGEVPTNVPARIVPAGRPLSRAAILFAGAAAVSACSSSSTGGGTSSTETGSSSSESSSKSSTTNSATGEIGDGGLVAAYGLHAFDAGFSSTTAESSGTSTSNSSGTSTSNSSSSTSEDGGVHIPDDGGAVAAYGVIANPDASN